MKVAMVCPYDWSAPGGVKTHIEGLASAMRTRGHDVMIIAPSSRPETGVSRVGSAVPIRFNGSVARLCFSAGAKRRVNRVLAEWAPDLLHLHEPGIPSVSLLALMQRTVPAVATFHASAESSLGYRLARPLLAPFLNRLRGRIAVSRASRALVSRYFPGDYVLIPNGIDLQRIGAAAPDREVASHKPCVLFVGRDEPRKGLPVALAAVERLRRSRDVRLVIAGSFPRDLPEWACALGPVDSQRLPAVYCAADVFLAPSLFGESFGIVLAEAMAAGTPVVCSALPGYIEAAAGACLHFPVGDAARAAESLHGVLGDASLRSDLVERGQARAAQLDWAVLADDVISVYRGAVS